MKGQDVIKKAGVRETIEDVNVSGDFYSELDDVVKEMLRKARSRAEANNRRTVMPKDL